MGGEGRGLTVGRITVYFSLGAMFPVPKRKIRVMTERMNWLRSDNGSVLLFVHGLYVKSSWAYIASKRFVR